MAGGGRKIAWDHPVAESEAVVLDGTHVIGGKVVAISQFQCHYRKPMK